MRTDPISDMLTRIRNAQQVGQHSTVVPYSKIKEAIAKILVEEGFIESYSIQEFEARVHQNLILSLKYTGERRERRPVISGLKRISRPGRRVYSRQRDIPRVLSGMGIAILSTPKGVMTGQRASQLGVGGEVLCYVW